MSDPLLEGKLARIGQPAPRKSRVGLVACLVAVPLGISIAEAGPLRILWLILAIVIALVCILRFKKERQILLHCVKAVGTVMERKQLRRRRGVRIKYGFLSADDCLYLGNAEGSNLPQEGQTLAIAYSANNPSINLPLQSFWFHEFAAVL